MLVVKICEQGQPRIVSLDLAILYSGMLLAKARRETIFPQASYMAGGRQSTSSSPSSITVDNIFYKELSNAILSYGGLGEGIPCRGTGQAFARPRLKVFQNSAFGFSLKKVRISFSVRTGNQIWRPAPLETRNNGFLARFPQKRAFSFVHFWRVDKLFVIIYNGTASNYQFGQTLSIWTV